MLSSCLLCMKVFNLLGDTHQSFFKIGEIYLAYTSTHETSAL